MSEIVRRLYLGLAIATLTPCLAAAQGFDEGKIRPGYTVLVRDLRGAETKGIVQSVEPSRLVVKYGAGVLRDPADPTKTLNDTRVFTAAEVDRVRRPMPIWDGAIKGALVGLIPAVLAAGVDCYDCGLGSFAALTTAVGAGVGLGIDAAWGPKTVYRNRGEARRVTLAPVITKERRGFAASIRF